jgi:hypothetical protein
MSTRKYRLQGFNEDHARAASLHLLRKWRSGEPLFRSSRPRRSKLLCGKSPAERNPGMKRTRTDAIFKKMNVEMSFKLKINVIRKYFELFL